MNAIWICFAIAALAPILHGSLRKRNLQKLSLLIFMLIPFGIFLHLFSLLRPLLENGPIVTSIPWIPDMGIYASTLTDGLSLLLLLLVSGIGFLVVVYTSGYLKDHPRLGSFYGFLFLFMGSMLGVVLSNDLILLFVFWELTSISSFLLIGFNHEKPESRTSALQALLVTGTGGLCLLAGFILLGIAGGTYELSELLTRSDQILSSPLVTPSLILILLGALTKSAQVPFHFWLPNAMVAPTPVSAYLHSATMVKAGVYLLARLSPIYLQHPLWQSALIPIGSVTAVVGGLLALKQVDLKKLLAYSTIASLGILFILLGVGSDDAVGAAIVYLLVHSLYKGALFMIAGGVDHGAGTRNVLGLRGLRRTMPLTSAAAALAALSMAGFPPLFGFIGKELLYQAKLDSPDANWIVTAMSVGSNMMMVTVAFIVGIGPFVGRRGISPKAPHESGLSLLLGPVVLSLTGLLLGLAPAGIGESLLSLAAGAVTGRPQTIHLKFWHGFNIVLFFSLITLAGGVALYFLRKRVRIWVKRFSRSSRVEPEAFYFRLLHWLNQLAGWQSRLIQGGGLTRAISVMILSVLLLLGWTLFTGRELLPEPSIADHSGPFTGTELLLCGFVITGAVTAAVTSSRVLALSALGLIGFTIAAIYTVYSAPDVAITQILVETLSVALTVFLISNLTLGKSSAPSWAARARVALAGGTGLLIATLAYIALQAEKQRLPISNSFLEKSFLEAHGRNVVNVILVDFRALDTLGEVTVLGVAALGVFSILARRKI